MANECVDVSDLPHIRPVTELQHGQDFVSDTSRARVYREYRGSWCISYTDVTGQRSTIPFTAAHEAWRLIELHDKWHQPTTGAADAWLKDLTIRVAG